MIVSARAAEAADSTIIGLMAEQAHREKVGARGAVIFLRHEAPQPPHEERIDSLIADAEHTVLVGEIEGVVVGYATMHQVELADGETIGAVPELYVLEDARGVGVGEEIMNLLITNAKAAGSVGIDSVSLPGDRNTKNFFETFGLKARALTVHRSFED